MVTRNHIQNDSYYNVIYSHSVEYFQEDLSALDEFMSSFERWYQLDYQIYREICLLVISYFEEVSCVSA